MTGSPSRCGSNCDPDHVDFVLGLNDGADRKSVV